MKCKICFKHELVKQEQDSFSSEQEFICPSCDLDGSDMEVIYTLRGYIQ